MFANEEDENNNVKDVDEEKLQEVLESEIEALDQALRAGIVHLIGENEVVAGKWAGIRKWFLINNAFNFLKKNLRQTENVFDIPQVHAKKGHTTTKKCLLQQKKKIVAIISKSLQ